MSYSPLRATTLALCGALLAACSGTATGPAATAPAATSVAVAPTIAPTSASAHTSAPARPTVAASPIPQQIAVGEPFPLEAGWWDNAVCYEVFVRSFADSDGDGVGDLNGLTERLDYINDGDPNAQQDLGATCIWLMPVAEAASYHGYDTVDYYTIERDYGTNDDFKRFVEAAHQRGIKVVIDLVLNHVSSEHPWFQEAARDPASPYRDYFIWSPTDPGYRGPWGDVAWHQSPAGNDYYYGVFWSGMPDLNYNNPAVTAEAQKISAFWRNDMGVDGFRLDAIKHVIEEGQVQENTPSTLAWLRGYRAFLQEAAPGTFTVGEIFNATPTILAPYYPDQLDSYFIFDLGERILTAATQGNGKPFGSAAQRVNDNLPFQRYAPFLTNHDQNRTMSRLGSMDKARVAAIALLTLPGLPFVYYGEEIGMTGVKGEPPTVDEPLRTPMQWTADASGFTSGTPWQPLQPDAATVNVAAQDASADSLLNLYRQLIHLHTSNPALATGGLASFDASTNDIAAYVRTSADQNLLVVINFDKETLEGATLTLESSDLAPGTYQLTQLFSSPATDTVAGTLTVTEGGAVATYALPSLAPYSGAVYALTP